MGCHPHVTAPEHFWRRRGEVSQGPAGRSGCHKLGTRSACTQLQAYKPGPRGWGEVAPSGVRPPGCRLQPTIPYCATCLGLRLPISEMGIILRPDAPVAVRIKEGTCGAQPGMGGAQRTPAVAVSAGASSMQNEAKTE